jgi:hypothetical protein
MAALVALRSLRPSAWAAVRSYSSRTPPVGVQYNTGDGYLDFDHTQCNHLEVDGEGKLAVIFGGFGFTKRQVSSCHSYDCPVMQY